MLLTQVSDSNSDFLATLYQWLQNEWGDVEPFAATKNGKSIPSPIIALEKGKLVGGLVFTRFPSPITQSQSVWVNAIFVQPENRKQGICSQLIKKAEKLVIELNEPELFAFSHIPQLYTRLNWEIINTHDTHFVLRSAKVTECFN